MLGTLEFSPIEVTAKILMNDWKLGENEEEFTVMRISLNGVNKKGVVENIVYELYDEYDSTTETSSMARTTGYTATAAANLVLDGLFNEKGVFPPELVGKHEACFEYVVNYLKQRKIIYNRVK
jgi:saccharopine dehydrogenase-like NADP-dependent oxidoreductase